MTRFYVTRHEYVGPNRHTVNDAQRILRGRYYDIQTDPPRTNMTHEVRTHGWLGTTNDWWSSACGEFATIEEARAYVEQETGGEYRLDIVEALKGRETERVERYYLESAEVLYDAPDYYGPLGDNDDQRAELGITGDTTDAEIEAMAKAHAAACRSDHNALLWGAEAYLARLRDSLRAAISQ